MKELCDLDGVLVVKAGQCRYGLKTEGPQGTGLAHKPTRFMTISPRIASQLEKRYPNRTGHAKTHHDHVPLMHGRAKVAQT